MLIEDIFILFLTGVQMSPFIFTPATPNQPNPIPSAPIRLSNLNCNHFKPIILSLLLFRFVKQNQILFIVSQ